MRSGCGTSVPLSAARTRASRRMVSLELARRCLGGRRRTKARPARANFSRMFWVPPPSRCGVLDRAARQALRVHPGGQRVERQEASASPDRRAGRRCSVFGHAGMLAQLARSVNMPPRNGAVDARRRLGKDWRMDLAALSAKPMRDDGVVFVPQALDAKALADAQAAYDWSLAHPGPAALAPSRSIATRRSTRTSTIRAASRLSRDAGGLAAAAADRRHLGHAGRLVHVRTGVPEGRRREPAHAVAPGFVLPRRWPATIWRWRGSPSTRSRKPTVLEFVRGSHKGPLYNGSRFELDDDTAPLHPSADAAAPAGHRGGRAARFDIVSFGVEPGDVVLFHPAMLHGGAPTHPGKRRRTLTLRFFGRDCFYDAAAGTRGAAASRARAHETGRSVPRSVVPEAALTCPRQAAGDAAVASSARTCLRASRTMCSMTSSQDQRRT